MLETMLMEISKPYFLYPFVILPILSLFTWTILKLLRVKNACNKSIFYALPFLVPLIVYLFYPPMVEVVMMRSPFNEEINKLGILPPSDTSFSIIGIVCIIGLVFGFFLFTFTHTFGVKMVCRLRCVTELYPKDEPELYSMIERLSNKAGIPRPKIGVTDGLEANAFTVGRGKKTIIVFSQGLFSLLSSLELEAVAAHEISHIKNNDFSFMAITSSLKLISFYNPISYLLSAAISREREILADMTSAKIASKPSDLKSALLKIAESPKSHTPILARLISGFFIVSEIGLIKSAFASHPSLDCRLVRIDHSEYSRGDKVKGFLAAAIIFSAFTLTGVVLFTSSSMNHIRTLGDPFRNPIGFTAFEGKSLQINSGYEVPIISSNTESYHMARFYPFLEMSSLYIDKVTKVRSVSFPIDLNMHQKSEDSPFKMIVNSLTSLVEPFMSIIQGKALILRTAAPPMLPFLNTSTHRVIITLSQPHIY